MRHKRKPIVPPELRNNPRLSETLNIPAKKLGDFRSGNFSAQIDALKFQGIDSATAQLVVEHYEYYKDKSNSGLGFIGEWGYWMLMQSYDMYKDSFSHFNQHNKNRPAPLLRVNGNGNMYPINSCCFLPGKGQKIRDINGNILQSVFPYTCNWEYGATPDMYIGPRLDSMNIQEFKRMQDPADGQGYRIIEIKTVSKVFKEFEPQHDAYGNLLKDCSGHYIPERDGNGSNILTGRKLIKVQINEHTHKQDAELVVIAKRGKRNDSAAHLGFITIGELESLRQKSDLRNTNCIQLNWLHTSTDELVDEIKNRIRIYKASDCKPRHR